ncbi:MAG: D-alanyl-D-alanine carboxypeptidase [Alphaproteobacteria bacterium]|nr:D-alanyl-D-alanine carboxypeptidase [Alphaproteobacteria bacterium]
MAIGAAVGLAAVVGAVPALAHHVSPSYAEPQGPVFEWILIDAETGQVLSEQNADVLTYPASLTKMMTLYMTFEALNQGRIRLDQGFYVSPYAANRAPSRMGLVAGDSVAVRDLILGIVTKSANDAATVLAENLGGGSEATFTQMMTQKARQLGMQNTWYHNASGLPDPQQRSTARDVARLALALYHQFPREYRYFSTREFQFRGEVLHTHNHLLEWYPGLDGLKTGFVNASGFNLAASATRDGHRLLGVIMGGRSAHGRDLQMASLLDQGFALLNSGRPVQQQGSSMLMATAPAAPPPPAMPAAPAVAAVPIAPAVATPAAAASAMAATAAAPAAIAAVRRLPVEEASEQAPRTSTLGRIAQSALRHLAPVGKAEAATLREAPPTEAWAIQLGAFKAQAAATQATRRVAHYAAVKGKTPEVVAPARHDRDHLYRARLLHFTPEGAQSACSELKRKGIACSVVRPT